MATVDLEWRDPVTTPLEDGTLRIEDTAQNEEGQTLKRTRIVRETVHKELIYDCVAERAKWWAHIPNRSNKPDEEPLVIPRKRAFRKDDMDAHYGQDLQDLIEDQSAAPKYRAGPRNLEKDLMDFDKIKDIISGGPVKNEPETGGQYVPPNMRGDQNDYNRRGYQNRDDASIRILNLSDRIEEGDLQHLIWQVAGLNYRRICLPKDPVTGHSKGFAFVSFERADQAEQAIAKLNNHGHDNFVLKVEWSQRKPQQ